MKGYFSFAFNRRGKTIIFIRKKWFLYELRYVTLPHVTLFFFSIRGRNRRVITNDNPLGDKAPSKLTLRWFIIRQGGLSGGSRASDKGGGRSSRP